MGSAIITFLIQRLATMLIGGDTFTRIENCVKRWEEKAKDDLEPVTTGADKKAAVLAEFQILGIELAGWLANLAIELAVGKLRTVAK
jgi:hypothetical protein